MTYAVVTMLDHPDDAHKVVDMLESSGFDRNNIESITTDPESQSFFKRLFTKEGGEEMEAEKAMEFMTGVGIPEDEAEDYADQVKKGRSMILVRTESESEAQHAREAIRRVPLGEEEEEPREGTARPTTGETAGRREGRTTGRKEGRGEERMQAAEEELAVGKKTTETGGVRVKKETTEEEVEEEVTLREEDVDVERRQVDRPLHEGEEAFEEEEIEVSETREEPVVEKQQKVREEVVVSKESEEHPEKIRETVRREHINVEEMSGRAGDRYDQFEPQLRSHYEDNYAGGDYGYDDYARGYRFGIALAEDEQLRSRNWEEVEPEAGRQWESEEGSNWDDFKAAVRHGWERIRGEGERPRT